MLCDNCKYWKRLDPSWGACKKLWRRGETIHDDITGGARIITKFSFGCALFAAQEVGPFYIECTGKGWKLKSAIAPEEPSLHYLFNAGAAAELRNWLNKLWEKRGGKEEQ